VSSGVRGSADRGEELSGLLPRLRAACQRQLGMEPFDVQIRAGLEMATGGVAEMQTGEGKTLAALMPMVAHGLRGRAWLATANDYLARRDADWLAPVYGEFGLKVGCVTGGMSAEERCRQYRQPIVYGTLREFGFDLLRDRLRERAGSHGLRAGRELQGGLPELLLVDEADSLLIDEATTPLLISGRAAEATAAEQAGHLLGARLAEPLREGQDFVFDPRTQRCQLTREGRCRVLGMPFPAGLEQTSTPQIFRWVETALQGRRMLHRDVHYVIRDHKVQIVDEGTGRIGEDRQWQGGLHQAVEAREGLPLTGRSQTVARMTVQDLVQQFSRKGGMTGTARECADELRGVYGLGVQVIPTRLPPRRQIWPPVLCRGLEEKWTRVVAAVREVLRSGRAVVVGTRSIAASEQLSERFRQAGLEHELLNARQPEREAEIIARAGQAGRLTVATNMAGRGTDIRLDAGVRERGGLHVIGTELHSSARIDRQLAGRCGRQGDPGSFQQFVSLEDSLLEQSASRFGRAVRPPRSYAGYVAIQRRLEAEERQARVLLMLHERDRREQMLTLGLDPLLDLLDD
jgi:preprotein translocase subunit SecA